MKTSGEVTLKLTIPEVVTLLCVLNETPEVLLRRTNSCIVGNGKVGSRHLVSATESTEFCETVLRASHHDSLWRKIYLLFGEQVQRVDSPQLVVTGDFK